MDLQALGPIFSQAETLARRLSVQRAATVGARVATTQVIIRNTHKPHDGQDSKHVTAQAINRSQSLLSTHRITVLAPKRSERIRFEQSLSDVWTRDTLPYPGMSHNRGGNIIRASAGSLVRKLSLASIHTPFARRSTSLMTVGSRFSNEAPLDNKQGNYPHLHHSIQQDEPLSHEIILDDPDELAEEAGEKRSEEGAVLPPARPSASRLSFNAKVDRLRRLSMKDGRRVSKTGAEPRPPKMSVESPQDVDMETSVEDRLGGGPGGKKRWSNPLGVLKNLSAEGVRHLLYSSK
jgi:hypothetical protein